MFRDSTAGKTAMPQVKNFDLIVIGSGPAGEKAGVKAAYFGKKVALIESQLLVAKAIQT
jgi:pyruvate/2-oxoglutarate dehydrogenase complex dihydrolipoamide dehydrogenase (E3) component